MILTEWNTEDAIAVAREEGREEVFQLIEQGFTVDEIKQRLTTKTTSSSEQ